jgi:hypothetical protein
MGRLLKLGVLAGVIAWLHSIGALDPKLWVDTVKRERERLPDQLKEALGAGRRAAAQAEEELGRELRGAFESR